MSVPSSPVDPAVHHGSELFRPTGDRTVEGEDTDWQRVSLMSLNDLSTRDWESWTQIRLARPEFRLPFFAPGFSRAVQSARGDVSVAVIRQGNVAVGFLPIHQHQGNGFPVGRFFNDAHNVITESSDSSLWDRLLSETGLRSFQFHALIGSQASDFPAHTCHGIVRSYRCELGSDSQAYLRRLGEEHKTVGRQGQKNRKLEREVGPLTLEFDCRDKEVLDQTIDLKRRQYQRTHILDLFTPSWTRRLMRELFDSKDESSGDVRGILSVLRAGDQIVAAHYGMIENGLLYYWFPAYDPKYAKYSPGTGLFCEILRNGTNHGIRCVDMGYGEQPYKLKQTDSTGEVLEGCFSRSAAYRRYRCGKTHLSSLVKRLPFKETVKRVRRKLLPNAGISKLD